MRHVLLLGLTLKFRVAPGNSLELELAAHHLRVEWRGDLTLDSIRLHERIRRPLEENPDAFASQLVTPSDRDSRHGDGRRGADDQ